MKKFPTKYKFKRSHKIKTVLGHKSSKLGRYTVGLRLNSTLYLKYNHLESARRTITRLLKPREVKNKKNLRYIKSSQKKYARRRKRVRAKKKKFLLIRANLCVPITKKPLQVRMGKGKGALDHWAHSAKASRPIIEISRKRLRLKRIVYLLKKSAIKLTGKKKISLSRQFLRREVNFTTKDQNNYC